MTIGFSPYCRDAIYRVSTCFQKGLFLLIFSIIAIPYTSWAQTESTHFFSFCPSSPIVKDHQGNTYRTVQIGSQCWMAENMRCTASPTGKRWIVNPSFSATQPEFAAYYAIPKDGRFGMLYNWTAALDLAGHHNSSKPLPKPVRGLCPEGWHLPDNSEWEKLFQTLGGHPVAGEMMKAFTQLWDPYDTKPKEVVGFDATPAGDYTETGYHHAGQQTTFWSADNFSRIEAWSCTVYDFKTEGYNYLNYKCYGHSVRCVKDDEAMRR